MGFGVLLVLSLGTLPFGPAACECARGGIVSRFRRSQIRAPGTDANFRTPTAICATRWIWSTFRFCKERNVL